MCLAVLPILVGTAYRYLAKDRRVEGDSCLLAGILLLEDILAI